MPVGKASRKKKGLINETSTTRSRHEEELKPSWEAPSKGSLQQTTSKITFIPLLVILLVYSAVYFNALFGGFVYDDNSQIVGNPWIRDIRNIPTIFFKGVWSFQSGLSTSNYYRPLMHIVYMLNYHLFGLNPWGFHLVNILFHCGASVLVFLIIRRLLNERMPAASPVYLSPAFLAAILFATHPIHTEAVTWIAGLPDVSFTFFYLLSLYFYISFRDGAKGGYLLSIFSFSVATLFKEPALTLPIMLIAYDHLVKKSDETILDGIKRYIPYAVVSGVYLLVRYYVLRSFVPTESYLGLSTYQLIINVFPLFREYLTSLLWPSNLNFWHTFHPISSLFEANGMISVFVTAIYFVVAAAAYRRNKTVFFGLSLIVVPLLPAFYIKAIGGKPFAERYLYLPSVGFVLLLAVFLSWIKEKLPRGVISITIAVLVIVGLYAVGTIKRNNAWKNNFTFWSDTVMKSPDSAIAHNELGLVYGSKAVDRAISEFQAALQLNPDYAEAHNNLGLAYGAKGQFDRAISEFQAALLVNPNLVEAHNNLGMAYGTKGQFDRAISEFQTALRINPEFELSRYYLASTYLEIGNVEMARREVEVVLNRKPDFDKARQLLNDINSRRH
jgi:protein O-mannosyl-transferase